VANFFDTMEQGSSSKPIREGAGLGEGQRMSSFSILPPWTTDSASMVEDMQSAASPRTAFKKINTTVLSKINPFVDMLYCNGPDAASVKPQPPSQKDFAVPSLPSNAQGGFGSKVPPAFCTVSFNSANGTQKSLSNSNKSSSPMVALKSHASRSVLSPKVEA
jgi:hypothetical protein